MKLSPVTIIIIGVSIAISVLSFAFFQEYYPNTIARNQYETYRDQLQLEVDKMPQAEKRVKDAQRMVQEKADAWRRIVAVRTPTPDIRTGGVSLNVNSYQLTVDSKKFRNSMQRALNAQLHRGGVTVVTGPLIPAPEESAESILANYYNYPAIPFPVVVFDLGSVTVRGTYEQIMAHVRSYSTMPRYLAVADGLSLTGTAPVLTGTYNLSIVGYIRGSKIFPPIPQGGATVSTTGTTGGGLPAPGG
jgi:hypothetical protein